MKRILFSSIALSLASLAAFGDACNEIADNEKRLACYDDMLDCANIKGTEARLRCFDRALTSAIEPGQQESSLLEDESASGQATVDGEVDKSDASTGTTARREESSRRDASEQQTDAFGKPRPKPKQEPRSIEAQIVKIESNAGGIDYLYLDNGHVWRETTDQRRFDVDQDVGQKVRIKPAIWGSYNMYAEDAKPFVKVRRVK